MIRRNWEKRGNIVMIRSQILKHDWSFITRSLLWLVNCNTSVFWLVLTSTSWRVWNCSSPTRVSLVSDTINVLKKTRSIVNSQYSLFVPGADWCITLSCGVRWEWEFLFFLITDERLHHTISVILINHKLMFIIIIVEMFDRTVQPHQVSTLNMWTLSSDGLIVINAKLWLADCCQYSTLIGWYLDMSSVVAVSALPGPSIVQSPDQLPAQVTVGGVVAPHLQPLVTRAGAQWCHLNGLRTQTRAPRHRTETQNIC